MPELCGPERLAKSGHLQIFMTKNETSSEEIESPGQPTARYYPWTEETEMHFLKMMLASPHFDTKEKMVFEHRIQLLLNSITEKLLLK
jgi:hypothetical protein